MAELIYDAALNWQFAALHEDEETVRELMVNMIDPKPGARILEVGCGTGRDSFRLARRLDASAVSCSCRICRPGWFIPASGG